MSIPRPKKKQTRKKKVVAKEVEVRAVTGSNTPTPLPEPSRLLKLKALFYKYTGIFLAHKETVEYLESDEFWTEFTRMAKYNKENDMDLQQLQGLLIGCWQAKIGFARPWARLPSKIYLLKFKYPLLKFPLNFIESVMTFFIVIKWDIESLVRKCKSDESK